MFANSSAVPDGTLSTLPRLPRLRAGLSHAAIPGWTHRIAIDSRVTILRSVFLLV